jgi:hypothetical protein
MFAILWNEKKWGGDTDAEMMSTILPDREVTGSFQRKQFKNHYLIYQILRPFWNSKVRYGDHDSPCHWFLSRSRRIQFPASFPSIYS